MDDRVSDNFTLMQSHMPRRPIGTGHSAIQAGLLEKAAHDWMTLPSHQFHMVFFIYLKTLNAGFEGQYITYRKMIQGDDDACGLGKNETSLRRTLLTLEREGVVKIDREYSSTKGLFISLDLDWSPVNTTV